MGREATERKNSVLITADQAGCPIIDFVARRFTYRCRAQWQAELAAGRFVLNGVTAGARDRLAAGDLLSYRMPPLPEPPVDRRYTVLHEDAELLAIDKPAPLPCHPGGRFFHNTLWALLREERGLAGPIFVHRLDRETSGVLLLAKTRQAARHCQAQFAGRLADKRYLVLVEGEFPAGAVKADGWLAPDPASVIRKKVRFYPEAGSPPPGGARSCSTSFLRLAGKGGLSLLAVWPHTGRGHQIRATLCTLGYPVVGDKLYGVDERLFFRHLEGSLTAADLHRLRLSCQALHAAGLRISHPATGRELSLSAPLPAGFRTLLETRGLDCREDDWRRLLPADF